MSEKFDPKIAHREFAVNCFNGVWELLDKGVERAPEEDVLMVHMAHASRYHWEQVGTPLNLARGDWQLARVYAILGEGETSWKYARSSLDLCHANGFDDFDLAFAYEALARACTVIGDISRRDEYLLLANEAGHAIAKQEDRDYFFSELKTVTA